MASYDGFWRARFDGELCLTFRGARAVMHSADCHVAQKFENKELFGSAGSGGVVYEGVSGSRIRVRMLDACGILHTDIVGPAEELPPLSQPTVEWKRAAPFVCDTPRGRGAAAAVP
jgi:hypothetical protein